MNEELLLRLVGALERIADALESDAPWPVKVEEMPEAWIP